MVSTAVESSFRMKDVSIVKRANGFLLERKRKQEHRAGTLKYAREVGESFVVSESQQSWDRSL